MFTSNMNMAVKCWMYACVYVQATIVRNAKDTAHTKAERNILEGVKVLKPYFYFCCVN